MIKRLFVLSAVLVSACVVACVNDPTQDDRTSTSTSTSTEEVVLTGTGTDTSTAQ